MDTKPRYLYTITKAFLDARSPYMSVREAQEEVKSAIGYIAPSDVGKQVFLVGDTIRVETAEERAKRLNALHTRQLRDFGQPISPWWNA